MRILRTDIKTGVVTETTDFTFSRPEVECIKAGGTVRTEFATYSLAKDGESGPKRESEPDLNAETDIVSEIGWLRDVEDSARLIKGRIGRAHRDLHFDKEIDVEGRLDELFTTSYKQLAEAERLAARERSRLEQIRKDGKK